MLSSCSFLQFLLCCFLFHHLQAFHSIKLRLLGSGRLAISWGFCSIAVVAAAAAATATTIAPVPPSIASRTTAASQAARGCCPRWQRSSHSHFPQAISTGWAAQHLLAKCEWRWWFHRYCAGAIISITTSTIAASRRFIGQTWLNIGKRRESHRFRARGRWGWLTTTWLTGAQLSTGRSYIWGLGKGSPSCKALGQRWATAGGASWCRRRLDKRKKKQSQLN